MNFQIKCEEMLEKIHERRDTPSLLLHACCGPCSSYVLEYLSKYFNITILYYNPNIYPEEEYRRRLEELKLRDELSKNDMILLEFLENEINDLREDIRLIRHFKGEEDLIKTHEMIDTYEGEVLGMSRKRVEIK